MNEVKTCPKCGSAMKRGNYLADYSATRLIKMGDLRGDKVIPFYCENCGYIELYNEKRVKR
jgi:predicted nucleic-acid-binding Zn-ribbon protein